MSILFDLPPLALSFFLVPFGLIFGSFANVLIHRLPLEKPEDRNVVTKPSHCPNCGAQVRWIHNIPLVSWLWLRGKCPHCAWPIPFRYFAVELLGGLILGGTHWLMPFGTLIWLKGMLCFYILLVLFFTDLTEFILPDVLQFPMMALGVLFTLPQLFWPDTTVRVVVDGWNWITAALFHNGLQPAPLFTHLAESITWKDSLIGLVAGYGVLWILANGYVLINNAIMTRLFHRPRIDEGMGMGDFKLLAWLGAFWGWQVLAGILAIGVFLGGLLAIFVWVFRKGTAHTRLPFGCPLALAVPIALFYGRTLWEGYMGYLGR